jgi:hypothetical protein
VVTAPLLTADGVPAPREAQRRATRPDVEAGLPIAAYGDDDLDEVARWIMTDGLPRDADELAAQVRSELGLVRRSNRVDIAVSSAVRRALGL